MNRTQRTALALALAAAFGVGLLTGTTQAASPTGPVRVAPPEASTFDNVLDAQEMADVVDITERIQPYLSIDENGLVQLDANVTAAELGVDEDFLSTYRDALAESNKLIERGDISVDADMRVTPSEELDMTFRLGGPGVGNPSPGLEVQAAGGQPSEAVPDWNVWNYNTGSMYYNSYNTYYNYRNNYYGLCNTMAAYQRCSRCAPSLQYFYSYNSSYLNNNCYQNYGVYYYLPYNNGCNSYNPCYGNLSYKPAYYWTQSRSDTYSCRGYTSNWQWQGYWCRY
jgi:hypothetical protein